MTDQRTFLELLEQMADPVWQAEHALKLAERAANRTDPWRWYCRICGAKGQADTEPERDAEGYAHLDACPFGRRFTVGTASHGRLRHVWTY